MIILFRVMEKMIIGLLTTLIMCENVRHGTTKNLPVGHVFAVDGSLESSPSKELARSSGKLYDRRRYLLHYFLIHNDGIYTSHKK